MKSPNPQMIILARESRGYRQVPLAKAIGVSQGLLSKVENGQLEASQELIRQLSQFLKYPESFFYQELEFRNLPLPFFRKRKSLSQSAISKIRAAVNVKRLQIKNLLRSVEVPELRVEPIDLREHRGAVELLAKELRAWWHLPPGPIENVTQLLESLGVLVVKCDFGTQQVDALSMHDVSDDLPPIVFVNMSFPGDRLRWTLIHELGHIIFHLHLAFPNPGIDCEEEADRFTREFLLPEAELRPYLNHLNLERLANLKLRWKISMQAIIMQAAAIGKISERKKQSLFAQMSKLGYRVNEPIPIPVEQPKLIDQIIRLYLDDLSYSPADLSQALCLFMPEFQVEYLRPTDKPLYLVRQ